MRVLVVDDSSVAQRVASLALAVHRVEVVLAATRGEALAMIAAGPFDAAILDLELDEGTGIEIAEALCASFPACRTVFVTGSTDPVLVAKATERGPVFSKLEGYAAPVAALFPR